MPSIPEDWHEPLEIVLQHELGEVQSLQTKWFPMPPSKDWMVIISDSMGHKKGLMLTQLYTPITEMLFMILEEEIIEGYPTWIAVPDDLVISPSRLSFLQALDVRLIPCKFPNWDAEPPIRAEMWNKPKE